jgi:hypothetical protein
MEANDKKQIIVLMYPGCIELEVMLAAELCNQVHQVRVATITGDGYRGSNGFSYNADFSIRAYPSSMSLPLRSILASYFMTQKSSWTPTSGFLGTNT